MKKLYKYCLSLLLTTSMALALSLSTINDGYKSINDVSININGQVSGNQDWVGIYRPGASNDTSNVLAWSWVNGKKTNITIDNIKNQRDLVRGGNFEVRLFFNASYSSEASTKFYLTSAMPELITGEPVVPEVGDTVNIYVNTVLSGNKDWMGLYKAGDDNSWANVIAWNWVQNNGKVSLTKGGKTTSAGDYEVRLFFNNSYKEEAHLGFQITDNDVGTIKTTKKTYNVNETVSVNVNMELSGDKDWIGIFPKGSDNVWGNVIKWAWVTDTGIVTINKTDYISNTDMPAGEYEVRLFFNNSYDMEATYTFSVGLGDNKYPETTTLTYRETDNTVQKPTVGNPTVDPVYNTKISMIHKSDNTIANYPKVQSWNKDMSLIRVKNRIYDANTLNETAITKGLGPNKAFSKICSPNSADFRWSNKDQNKFYVLNSNRRFIGGKIVGDTTDCNTVLLDLSEYETVEFGPYSEGNIDNNDRYVIFVAKKYNDMNIYMILFDIQKKKIVWKDKKVAKDRWVNPNGNWKTEKLDWVSVSQSGKYIVMSSWKYNPMYRFDINLNNKVKLQYSDEKGNLHAMGEHGDFGFDSNGNEVFVQNVSLGDAKKTKGIYMFNLEKPHELAKRILTGMYGGGHVSCRNVERPGWCYVTKQEEGYRDVFALKLDASHPNTVEYFSQIHLKDDYRIDKDGKKHIYLETYGSPSPDGTKMIFNSHWGTNSVDTFIAEVK